ncbi:hypothetical protein WJX72_003727 [[Myrmecia] bisecta]|uniref:CCZ1/INTU/HSP4 first Longin domain-containing protein n=1 Tax=[Myrmecia] bisecta TaxID=41462 RepID=A0AAW1QPT4_9CHLO
MASTLKPDREEKPDSRPLQLCIFDDRRGTVEGEEPDKILAFFPADVPVDEQTAAVGLVQAMVAFTSIFSQDAPADTMQAEKHRWVIHTCEPHIQMMLIANRQWHSAPVRDEGLRHLLRQLYSIFTLLHGPLQRLLDQDASGSAARTALKGVVAEFGDRLARGKGNEFISLHNPLSMRDGVPWLPLPRPLFTSMQSIINTLMLTSIRGSPAVHGALLLHEHFLLWSTVALADTSALYQCALHALLPAVRAVTQPSISKRLAKALPNSTASFRSRSAVQPQRVPLSSKAWRLLPTGVLGLRNGDAPYDANADVDIPHTWLQGGETQCGLLPFRAGDFLLLVLLNDRMSASPEVLSAISQAAVAPLKKLSGRATEELHRVNRFHVPGYRYLYKDTMLGAVRASPASKVATLSKESLALANSVRAELDAEERCREAEPTQVRYAEVLVRGPHDCWVTAKQAGQHEVSIVLEQRNEDDLLEVSKVAQKLTSKHMPNTFA